MRTGWGLLGVGALASCLAPIDYTGKSCPDGQCPSGYVCSNGTCQTLGDAGGATDAGAAVDTACTQMLGAYHTLFSRCFGGPLLFWQRSFPIGTYCQTLEASVTAGRVTFNPDPAVLDECTNTIQSMSCTDAYLTAAAYKRFACASLFIPEIANLGGCHMSEECADTTALCNTSSSCPGTCLSLPTSGQACSFLCAEGFSCVSGSCRGLGTAGATCKSDFDCAAGAYYCLPDAGACVAALGAGATCTALSQVSPECGTGLGCGGVPGNLTCATGLRLGQTCSGEFRCAVGLYCSQQACVDWPTVGDPCGPIQGDVANCAFSYCASDGGAGTCAAFSPIGTPCNPASTPNNCGWFARCAVGACAGGNCCVPLFCQ